MPPRLSLRLFPQPISSIAPALSIGASPLCLFLLPFVNSRELLNSQVRPPTQIRAASILASLSDNPTAYNKRIRRGLGPASGKGKTAGRGHKGQNQRGTKRPGFNGGQTPDEIVHGPSGFTNIFAPEISKVNLDRLQEWINQGRIDPSQPITLRELVKTRCIHGIKDGVKLLARGGPEALKQPITIVVSRASASAIAAVEAAGGSITTRYYTRHAIKRILSGKTDPYVSMAWKDMVANTKDAPATEPRIGMGMDKGLEKGNGFQYRLPDPTKRSDIEYYRDPAHRGYLSYLVGEGESPSLFFTPPSKDGQKKRKSTKAMGENKIW
ncbi:YmL10 [Myotisia sp. PD_48]|nr:YmL10 [Myotisia sp. PD_48]